MTDRRIVAAASIAFLIPLLGGCDHKAADDGGASTLGVIVDVPPIHVEQTVVELQDGQPMREQLYNQAAAGCAAAVRQAPQFAFRPLSGSDAAKVGRTYWQTWFDGKRSAARFDTWDYTVGAGTRDGCVFSLSHTAGISVDDGVHRYRIDPLTGEREEDSMPSAGGRMPLDGGDGKLTPEQTQTGWQLLGEASAAGQSCLHWKGPDGTESCSWSGGARWGFSQGEGSDQATSYDPGRVVLWVRPAGGDGSALTTRAMTVGQPIDGSVFDPGGIEDKR